MFRSCHDCGGLITKLCLTLAIAWTVAHQIPLSMGFSRQEYWSGLPYSFPRDLSNSKKKQDLRLSPGADIQNLRDRPSKGILEEAARGVKGHPASQVMMVFQGGRGANCQITQA